MEFTPAELMARKLETSPDVRRLLELAAECGPGGVELLVRRIRGLAERQGAGAPGRPLAAEGRSPVASGVH